MAHEFGIFMAALYFIFLGAVIIIVATAMLRLRRK